MYIFLFEKSVITSRRFPVSHSRGVKLFPESTDKNNEFSVERA